MGRTAPSVLFFCDICTCEFECNLDEKSLIVLCDKRYSPIDIEPNCYAHSCPNCTNVCIADSFCCVKGLKQNNITIKAHQDIYADNQYVLIKRAFEDCEVE